jgi:integrase
MLAVNEAHDATRPSTEITIGEFVAQHYLPHKERKWKLSSRLTTADRIERHITGSIGQVLVSEVTRARLQAFMDAKAAEGLGKSMLDHLRFDLRDILALAEADGLAARNAAARLQTPRTAPQAEKRVRTIRDILRGLAALAVRERLIWKLAVFVGMRPGEILALRRRHVHADHVEIEARVYKGVIDTPKSRRSKRQAAISASLGQELQEWLRLINANPDAWLFPSEAGSTPVRPENLWRSAIAPRLKPLGLEWVNFQVLRRSQASLSHAAGVDPKVRADQLGHGIGVDLDEYTATSLLQRQAAVQTLEDSILQ